MSNFKTGDRVAWQYTHATGWRTRFKRVKHGDYVGKSKHTYKHWRKPGAAQMAYVQFDGNKRMSLVRVSELVALDPPNVTEASKSAQSVDRSEDKA